MGAAEEQGGACGLVKRPLVLPGFWQFYPVRAGLAKVR